jgi:sporulation protein YlmC with PRC-barrel domain
VGRVIDFLVNSETGQITCIVVRGWPLWRHKDVMVPISMIAKIEENTIFLKLDKHTFEALPMISQAEHLFTNKPTS